MSGEGGNLKLSKYMCLTCKKPFRAWFAMTPIRKGECAKCYIARTTPRRKKRGR